MPAGQWVRPDIVGPAIFPPPIFPATGGFIAGLSPSSSGSGGSNIAAATQALTLATTAFGTVNDVGNFAPIPMSFVASGVATSGGGSIPPSPRQQSAPVVTTSSATPITLQLTQQPQMGNWLVIVIGAANAPGGTGAGPFFAPFTSAGNNGGVTTWNAVREGPTAVDYASSSIFYGVVTTNATATGGFYNVLLDVDLVNPGPNGYSSQQAAVIELTNVGGFDQSVANDSFSPGLTMGPGPLTPQFPNEFLVVVYSCDPGGPSAAPTGWDTVGTPAMTINGTSGFPGLANYLVASTQQNPVVTFVGSSQAASATMAAFYGTSTGLTAPGIPINVSAAPAVDSAVIQWSQALSGGTPATYTINQTVGSTTTQYTLVSGSPFTTPKTLTPGLTYTFSVQAVNNAGTSAKSGTASAIPAAAPTSVEVVLIGPGSNPSQAYLQNLVNWGFGGIVLGLATGNGMDAYLASGGGSTPGTTAFQNQFQPNQLCAGPTGQPSGHGPQVSTDAHYSGMRTAQAVTTLCHTGLSPSTANPSGRLNVYIGIPFMNTYWGGQDHDPTYCAPFLGGWYGADQTTGTYNGYKDAFGRGWPDWYRMCADLGDAIQWIGADGIYLDNEDDQIQSNTLWAWQTWENNFGQSTPTTITTTTNPGTGGNPGWMNWQLGNRTQAQTQTLAYTAGQKMMFYINNGRCDSVVGNLHAANGNNYKYVSYMSDAKSGIPGGWSGSPGSPGTTTYIYTPGAAGATTNPNSPGTGAVWTAYTKDQSLTQGVWWYWLAGLATGTGGQVIAGDSAFYGGFTSTNWTYDVNAMVPSTFNAAMNGAAGPPPGGFSLPSNVFICPMIWPLTQTAGTGPDGIDWGQSQWNSQHPQIISAVKATGGNYCYNIYLPNPPQNFNNDPFSSPVGANYTPVNS